MDQHMAIEAIACRQDMHDGGALVRWVHSESNRADGLTKIDAKSLEPLMAVITRSRWKLVNDPDFVSSKNGRKLDETFSTATRRQLLLVSEMKNLHQCRCTRIDSRHISTSGDIRYIREGVRHP